jgi:hypothetical protein
MEPELAYPALHIDRLTPREQEAVATVLAAQELLAYTSAVGADSETWKYLAAEYLAEQLPGDGAITSELGRLNAVRRALGLIALDLEDWAYRRLVTR